ncbi:MAG: DUF1735 domain-containing protein [Porphyromonadaceae bacterium]|nr:DUF1735 domain-containing protein [Porphyromonadaceae bacterium]
MVESCDTNEKFSEEMYKKVFCLVGNNDNVYPAVHSFKDEVSDGFVSVYCGGTNPVDEDITIELEYDDEIIDTYNYKYYDLKYDQYAKKLDASKYEILTFTATMKAGQKDPYVTIPLKIYTTGISPDSVYFIPLKIKSISGNHEMNPEMISVMYRPLVENDYAQTKVATSYASRGERNGKEIVSTKTMYPLTANQCRITADTQTGLVDNKADLDLIKKYGMIIAVAENNLVTLSPYGTIQVELLGEPDENRYEVADFKRFYLHYQYRTLVTPATEGTEAGYSAWTVIEEVLKRQN